MFAFEIEDTLMTGMADIGGNCPAPSYWYSEWACCCKNACCWSGCFIGEIPPKDCLEGVPGAEWKYFNSIGAYRAVRTSELEVY